MRTFPALSFACSSPPDEDEVGLILALVDEAGPTGVITNDLDVRVFFMTATSRDLAEAIVGREAPTRAVTAIDVPDEQWAERSQASIGAIRVGAIRVRPPWVDPDGAPHDVVVQPSMGFGTGHHASTRLCLWHLQQVAVAGRSVTDLGTGSGVLAVAAARLGAATVMAVDYDPDALDCAKDTVARNGVEGVVRIASADLTGGLTGMGTADVVLANLTGQMLVRLAAAFATLATSRGCLVLGGITTAEAAEVERAYADAGWRVADRRTEEEWVGLRLERRPGPTSPSASTTR
jgi:ribosomal protein L11 methyltransferase